MAADAPVDVAAIKRLEPGCDVIACLGVNAGFARALPRSLHF